MSNTNEEVATPRTDTVERDMSGVGIVIRTKFVTADFARQLERELDAAKRDANQWETQCKVARIQRDNAESDCKQSAIDSIRALHERNEARWKCDRLADLLQEFVDDTEECDQMIDLLVRSREVLAAVKGVES